MKRGTPDHPKTKRLSKVLEVPLWGAVGILESIWHFAMRYSPQGNIGKFSDHEIAEGIGWSGDAGKLMSALVDCGWLDRDQEHRYLVHDWEDHCDRSVSKYLKDNQLTFICGNGTPKCAPKCAPGGNPNIQVGALSAPDSYPEPYPKPEPDSYTSLPAEGVCEHVGPIPDSHLEEIWRWWPKERKIGRTAAEPEIQSAIRRVAQERGWDLIRAYGWLLSRVKAYARSDVVLRGPAQYIPAPAKWFREGRYNDDDAAWKLAGNNGTPKERTALDVLDDGGPR